MSPEKEESAKSNQLKNGRNEFKEGEVDSSYVKDDDLDLLVKRIENLKPESTGV